MEKKAIIIGAGPAGLTAAYELLTRTAIKPVILEKSGDIGGISKTVNYKGNRIDIGGHRFFSKSDRVMNWWLKMMPLAAGQVDSFDISYHTQTHKIWAAAGSTPQPAPADPDKVMLVRPRLSRIYFLRKFFSYPLQLSIETLRKLGIATTIAILFSYLKAQLNPRRPEESLEDFMINRFGQVLYELFFKDYTQKVWGVPCRDIPAEWGAQRIKGISVAKAIGHAIKSATAPKSKGGLSQKGTETSLIEQFLYPKLGPGQLWEEVASKVQSMGGLIHLNYVVDKVYTGADGTQITAIAATNTQSGASLYLEGDYFFSTMPVKELIAAIDGPVPDNVKRVAAALQYRDFITVGVLLKQLSALDKATGQWKPLDLNDTWIYIQDKEVTVGRVQIFNNWSPAMVNIPGTVWIGMEFFCNTTDAFWNLPDEKVKKLAIGELEKIGLAYHENVIDATVLRMEKTYPAYFGAYKQFDQVRSYTDRLENLFLVGRNGMHKYNNADHSMLTAMVAVDNIAAGITRKDNIWAINTEAEYHEQKQPSTSTQPIKSQQQMEKDSLIYTERPLPFLKWMLAGKLNRIYLIAGTFIAVLCFAIFKWFYPLPDFHYDDSTLYILQAHKNVGAGMWPVGYSKILHYLGPIAHSSALLICFQYLVFLVSSLYFFFTLRYFFRQSEVVSILVLAFLIANPVFLYLNNYIMSDGLFTSLSLVWFAHLIWIMYRPSRQQIVLHSLLLIVLFTMRYNAMYYPIVTAGAYLFSHRKLAHKLYGIALPLLLILAFVRYTEDQVEQMSGTRQFSPFSGWQIANNALYTYNNTQREKMAPLPDYLVNLDRTTRSYFKAIPANRDLFVHPNQGTFYLWAEESPLKIYMKSLYKNDSTTDYFTKWAGVAPIFAKYGTTIIKRFPLQYAQHYLWPNTIRYAVPPLEALRFYNASRDTLERAAQLWFGLASKQAHTRTKALPERVLSYCPTVFMIVNIYFLINILLITFNPAIRQNLGGYYKLHWLMIVFWIANIGFSVLASPVVMRYQLFPMTGLFSICLLSVQLLLNKELADRKEASFSSPVSGIGKTANI